MSADFDIYARALVGGGQGRDGRLGIPESCPVRVCIELLLPDEPGMRCDSHAAIECSRWSALRARVHSRALAIPRTAALPAVVVVALR